MTGKSHVAIGAATGYLLQSTSIMQSNIGKIGMIPFAGFDCFLGLLLGSIIADLDTANSIISRTLVPVRNNILREVILYSVGLLFLMSPWALLKYLGIIVLVGKLSGAIGCHRALFHSILGLGLNVVPVYFLQARLGWNILVPFIIGYGLHLVADMFTSYGVPLFFPFGKRT